MTIMNSQYVYFKLLLWLPNIGQTLSVNDEIHLFLSVFLSSCYSIL